MSKFAKGMYLLGMVVATSALYFLIFEAGDYLNTESQPEVNAPPTSSGEEEALLDTGGDGSNGGSGNETTSESTDSNSTSGDADAGDSSTVQMDTQEEADFPHLAIVGVEAEPIPWVLEPGPYHTVCDYFRIKLRFTVRNIGKAAFPPEGVTPGLANRGYLLWTVLYNGEESGDNETRIYQPHLVTWNYSEIQYQEALDIIPPQGAITIEREFRAALDHPLNPFQVVAWFHPPVTTPAGSSKIGRTQERGTADSQPVEGSRLETEIPSPDAPVIKIQETISGGERTVLQLEQAPFVSEEFRIDGPDVEPIKLIWIDNAGGKENHYDTGVVFENLGTTAVGSVHVSFYVPFAKLNAEDLEIIDRISWSYEIPGPITKGKYAVVFCGIEAEGAPVLVEELELMRISVQLHCPEYSPGPISIGDVDRTNDVNKGVAVGPYYPEGYDPKIHTSEWIGEQVARELEDLLGSCVKVVRIGCDSGG